MRAVFVGRHSFALLVAVGFGWGIVAAPFHLLMFRGYLPPPTLDPLGIARVLIDVPFLVGGLCLTALGGGSGGPLTTFPVVWLASALSGAAIGCLAGALFAQRGMSPRADTA